ncbi:MAG: non-canonical purine NTP pyrophosphatase [bacterium]|nr:non-canonical purine NTP pyrophosphatase [bacterium]
MNDLVFVTGNMNKVKQVEKYLGQTLEHEHVDLDEIQDLDPAVVLEHKAKEAYRILQRPVLVEDASLVFHALGKLPGPFIKFFLQELDTGGLIRLLDGNDDRRATHTVIFGIYDGKSFHEFSASINGVIATDVKGSGGFGFDPTFIPDGQEQTRAEMDEETYAKYQPRNHAAKKLANFIENNK